MPTREVAMDRREFIKRFATYAAAGALGLSGVRLFSQQSPRGSNGTASDAPSIPDLVAVKGGEPDVMFDRGIAALGGIGRFVHPGHTVVIKPNMSWNVNPERGATTNPKLIRRIVEHCDQARARRIYLLDNTLDTWRLSYRESGIESAAKEAGGTLVPASSNRYYHDVTVPGAVLLRSAQVHELVIEADVFINVPVLKHHGSARITSAMKNLMGVVWDRNWYHRRGLNQCIADFPLYRKPDLNVVDAYRVMMSGGPRGSSYAARTELMKMQILSSDIVAADVASAKTWGIEPDHVRYIALGAENGLGEYDLSSLSIQRLLV